MNSVKSCFSAIAAVFKISPSYMLYCICWSIFMALYDMVFIFAMPMTLNNILSGVPIPTIIITLLCILLLTLIIDITFSFLQSSYAEKKKVEISNTLQKSIYIKTVGIDINNYDDPEFYNNFIIASSNYGEKTLKTVDMVKKLVQKILVWIGTSAFILQYDAVVLLLIIFSFLAVLTVNTIFKKTCFKIDLITTPLKRKRNYYHRVFYEPRYAKDLRLHIELPHKLISNYKKANREFLNANLKAAPVFIVLYILQYYFFTLFIYKGVISLYLGYRFFIAENINIALFFALYNTVAPLSDILGQIKDSITEFYSDGLYFEKIKEFLKTPSFVKAPIKDEDISDFNKLEVRNLSFSYKSGLENVLSNICFEIHKGDRIAIVGHNGAGKSTLIKLILRLYDYDLGDISYNNESIKALDARKYREKFSTMFQDYRLFAFSVKSNVAMSPESDDVQIYDALTLAGLKNKIDSLERGIYTPITSEYDENGVDFSGGERQKIAIARNYYKRNKIIILDEPSASLDALSEKNLYQEILKNTDDTIIFISHRLSTTVNCNKIFLMENGRIIEQGTHDELMAANGTYHKMFMLQAQGYVN